MSETTVTIARTAGEAAREARALELRYFAWVRERVGQSHEQVESRAATVAELVAELAARDEAHAYAFENLQGLRVALDQELSEFSASLDGVREVAFFPPMTGG